MASVIAGAAGCGAADEPIDPASFELRDLLGVTPKVAAAWTAAQREGARQVLAAGLAAREPVALDVAAGRVDEGELVGALAAADDRLVDRDRDALGLVIVEGLGGQADGRAIEARAAMAALGGEAVATTMTLELDPQAWTCPEAAPCDFELLAALAEDAAPGVPRVRVEPVAQLAVIAALAPGNDGTPSLLVNPIVLAVGAGGPAAGGASGGAGGEARASSGAGAAPAYVAPVRRGVSIAPLVTTTWSYDPTLSACADEVRRNCQSCLAGGACDEIWPGVSGTDACMMLEQQPGQNYDFLCANLAVSLGDVGTCLRANVPSCTFDTSAVGDPAKLTNNRNFVDDSACLDGLNACLQQLYGTSSDSSNGCDCGGCDCGGCDCGGCDCNDNQSDSCSLKDQNQNNDCNNCNNDNGSGGCGGCNDSNGGNSCGGGGSSGSCTVARTPAARGP
ncbi:MAG TPA: hypothetical protein VHE35_03130, partial [Kofleriaceae bacterium]|nr:hypothetical protein [Kofleriaceae bacterium]